jgi:hypothetical protein
MRNVARGVDDAITVKRTVTLRRNDMTEHTANLELARAAARIDCEDAWMRPSTCNRPTVRTWRMVDSITLATLVCVVVSLVWGAL